MIYNNNYGLFKFYFQENNGFLVGLESEINLDYEKARLNMNELDQSQFKKSKTVKTANKDDDGFEDAGSVDLSSLGLRLG